MSTEKTAAKPEKQIPETQETQPGLEFRMNPPPIAMRDDYRGSGKMQGLCAIVTGGDSGIGRAVSLHFAREGADIAIIYLNETQDAEDTARAVEAEGRKCLAIAGDCSSSTFCKKAVAEVVDHFGKLDVLVNCIAEQHPQDDIRNISESQLRKTFETNFFGYFFMIQAALDHLKEGASIINTGSITSFRGSPHLMDYSGTKGAIQVLTFSLASELARKGIRVNGVAPGPIWTPLIPSSFGAEQLKKFGENTLMKRAGQPAEVAPAYVYLASADASYVTGQFIHVNGGGYMPL